MGEVVVRLKRENAQKILDRKAVVQKMVSETLPEQIELRDQLRAALDSLPVEEETEYRVVGTRDGEEGELFTYPELKPIRDFGDIYRAGDVFSDVRDQRRTTTTFSDGSSLIGPWVDLEEGGDAS